MRRELNEGLAVGAGWMVERTHALTGSVATAR